MQAEGAKHHFDAHQLQGDIGQGGEDAGDGHQQCQCRAGIAFAHEVAAGDMAALFGDAPQARERQEHEGKGDEGVGHGKEADGAHAEHQRRHGDEGVGSVEIATQQEPGDEGAEAASAKPPFIQLIKVGAAPVGGDEAQHGNQNEQADKDPECSRHD